MKKNWVILLLLGLIGGCVRAGDFDLLPVRRQVLNVINGYVVEPADSDEKIVANESAREKSFALNKTATAKVGDTVLSDKIYDKKTYRKLLFRPNKKGVINTLSYPLNLDNTLEYEIKGWVTIDGVRYGLIEGNVDDYVFLFDEKGDFYNKAGMIDDGVLRVLDEEIFVYPSDLKMNTIVSMRDETDNIKTGFELKYAGTKLDRIWFDYLDYNQENNNSGVFEKISFPNKSGLIRIGDVGMRILSADEDAVTYIVLTDD